MGFTATKDTTGVMVVGVDGQLIVGNRQELKQLVQEAVDHGEKKFLVDFSKAGYIDSSGLGALVSISKKVREQGGELRLSGLNEDLSSLFELTKLDTLFSISDSTKQALAAFWRRDPAPPPCRPPQRGPVPPGGGQHPHPERHRRGARVG